MKQTLKARATEWALGYTSEGMPQVAVSFTITEGPRTGEGITWYGYFTEKTQARTIESLRHCGWTGDDFADMQGLDANEVQLVTEPDTFNGTTREKVQWVNKAGGGVQLKSRMSEAQAKQFAAQMKGHVIAQKQAAGAPVGGAAAKPPGMAPDATPMNKVPF